MGRLPSRGRERKDRTRGETTISQLGVRIRFGFVAGSGFRRGRQVFFCSEEARQVIVQYNYPVAKQWAVEQEK